VARWVLLKAQAFRASYDDNRSIAGILRYCPGLAHAGQDSCEPIGTTCHDAAARTQIPTDMFN